VDDQMNAYTLKNRKNEFYNKIIRVQNEFNKEKTAATFIKSTTLLITQQFLFDFLLFFLEISFIVEIC